MAFQWHDGYYQSTTGRYWKYRYEYINVRNSAGASGTSVIGTLPNGNYWLVIYEETQINGVLWVKHDGGRGAGYSGTAGWSATYSDGTYIQTNKDGAYPPGQEWVPGYYTGSVTINYYWPDADLKNQKQTDKTQTITANHTSSKPTFKTLDGLKDVIEKSNPSLNTIGATLTAKYDGGEFKKYRYKLGKDVYTFKGWTSTSSADIIDDVTPGYKPNTTYTAEDLNLYPTFQKSQGYTWDTSPTVDNAPAKEVSKTVKVTFFGAEITPNPQTITNKETYDFSSWNPQIPVDLTSDLTVQAVYSTNPTIIKGNITLPTSTKPGFEFLGWARTNGASIQDYNIGSKFESLIDVTLYAVWKAMGLAYIKLPTSSTPTPHLIYIGKSTGSSTSPKVEMIQYIPYIYIKKPDGTYEWRIY